MLKFTAHAIKDNNMFRIVNSTADVWLYTQAYEEIRDLFTKDEFCKRIVKKVAQSDILSPYAISSKYIGVRDLHHLSGGVSTILDIFFRLKLKKPNFYFESACIGNNCIPYLMELADKYDITMMSTTPLEITNDLFRKYPNKIFSLDENRFITSVDNYNDVFQKHYTAYIDECEKGWNRENFIDKIKYEKLMNTFIPNEFNFKFVDHEYNIPLKYKINILCGDSAIGKTYMTVMIDELKQSHNTNLADSNISLDDIRINISVAELQYISKQKDRLLIILDENSKLMQYLLSGNILYNRENTLKGATIEDILDYMINSESVFLFITRRTDTLYTLPQDAILELVNNGDGFNHIAKPYQSISKKHNISVNGLSPIIF